MDMNFILNKYLFIWYLLYSSSVTSDINKVKELLYRDSRKEYVLLEKEKNNILKDLIDYIPDDDFIFNYVENTESYKKLKQETNRYRLSLLELWDNNRKQILKELNKLLRYKPDLKYNLCVIHPDLNIVEDNYKEHLFILGKKIDAKEKIGFLIFIIFKIIKNEYNLFKPNESNIVNSILELVLLNELYTRLTKESKYNIGRFELRNIKNKIYPYFLMYLGITSDDFEKYMVRDNIYFKKDDIVFNESLKLMDLYSFINYIIKNKEQIMSNKNIGIKKIDTEVL